MTIPLESEPIQRVELKRRASALKLYGLIAHWDEVPEGQLPWVSSLLEWEDLERKRRGLERRLSTAHIGHFRSLADFDWNWPTQCDKAAISALMTLRFIEETANVRRKSEQTPSDVLGSGGRFRRFLGRTGRLRVDVSACHCLVLLRLDAPPGFLLAFKVRGSTFDVRLEVARVDEAPRPGEL